MRTLARLATLAVFALGACAAPAMDAFGTTVRSAGAYDRPDGPDEVFLELHGVAGFHDGLYSLSIPANWRDRPRTRRARDGVSRLASLLDEPVERIAPDHPADLRAHRESGIMPTSWSARNGNLLVQVLRDPARELPQAAHVYAFHLRRRGEKRVVELYGRAGVDWVFLRKVELDSSRSGAGWHLARAVVYPPAFAVDGALVAAPIVAGILLTAVLLGA